jgi:hypothetical protein
MNTKDLHIVSRLFQIVPVNQSVVKMVPEQAGSLKKNWSDGAFTFWIAEFGFWIFSFPLCFVFFLIPNPKSEIQN